MREWQKTARKNIRKLTKDEAVKIIESLSKEITADRPCVRELTEGYSSQSINFWVITELGIKAGLLNSRRGR